jgi:hypothetical protein
MWLSRENKLALLIFAALVVLTIASASQGRPLIYQGF